VDFGIAKLSETKDPLNQALTGIGDVVGTPLYTSPEQCMGERVDARSDIYSLGCTLFEAVTGTLPFRARNPTETMMMHQSAPPPTLSKVCPDRQFPSMMEDIIAIALAKHPSDRYQSMEQMAGALTAFLEIDKPLINLPIKIANAPIRGRVNFGLPGVTKLDFSDSRHLTMESVNTLRKINKQLKVFVGADGTDGEALAWVDNWDLEQLYFGRTKRISSFLRKIAPGTHLTRLGLGTALPALNGIDCENITALSNLVYLDLGNNKLNDKYLRILSRLPKLQELRIENCGITADNIDTLAKFKKLKVLRIDSGKCNELDLQKLKKALPGVAISG